GADGPDHPAVPAAVAAHERRPGGVGIEAGDGRHQRFTTRVGDRCKACHDQCLPILAEKQPRVALCAWMVSISGVWNSCLMAASASPGWASTAAAIIPLLSKPRSESTRVANTGGASSMNSACSTSATKIAWLAR